MTATAKISRRGFRKAPADVKPRAEHLLDCYIADAPFDTYAVLATLRPATYCGPGSPGDRGAWVLSISVLSSSRKPAVIIDVIEA